MCGRRSHPCGSRGVSYGNGVAPGGGASSTM